MAGRPVLSPMSDADFDVIEAAVMETARGRWFLAEHVRRNRYAETRGLLDALVRIETKIDSVPRDQQLDRVRMSIIEMAQAIARTKDEIAAIKPAHDIEGHFGEVTEEIDAIVTTTETATGDILHAAEQIQEVAWTLRERGFEGPICDMLDERATDIYTACSFQDLTGQRIRKVVSVLRYLESRINALIDIWGSEGVLPAPETTAAAEEHSLGRKLAHGPGRPGVALEQSAIDAMLDEAIAGPGAVAQPPAGKRAPGAPVAMNDIVMVELANIIDIESVAFDRHDDVVAVDAAVPEPGAAADDENPAPMEPVLQAVEAPSIAGAPDAAPPDAPQSDADAAPLAPAVLSTAEIDQLSPVQRIALFT